MGQLDYPFQNAPPRRRATSGAYPLVTGGYRGYRGVQGVQGKEDPGRSAEGTQGVQGVQGVQERYSSKGTQDLGPCAKTLREASTTRTTVLHTRPARLASECSVAIATLPICKPFSRDTAKT